MTYLIEKLSSWQAGKWEIAWGFKPKSLVKAMSENEAIDIFNRRVAKCRAPYRLVDYIGMGYNPTVKILAKTGIPKQ